MVSERKEIKPFIREFLKERGADITPLKEYIHKLYRPEKFFASPVDFGCIVCTARNRSPVYVTKEMMKEHGEDWLIATASAFPAFPVHTIEGQDYIDGGYFDNLPIDYAFRLGAEEIIAIDLNSEPNHMNYLNRPDITYVFPKVETGSFLSFDRRTIERLETLGYYDTMKAFHVFDGVRYTFERTKIPSWFKAFEREMLMLETRIKLASNVSEYLRSDQYITDRMLARQHAKVLDEKQLFFGFMDNMMEICGCDEEKVWTFKDARNVILAEFAECAKEDYPYLPELSVDKMLAYTKSLDTKGIISKLVHFGLYNEHVFFPESICLTMYPFETALAMFTIQLMMELKEE